jgi:hypothetical protein
MLTGFQILIQEVDGDAGWANMIDFVSRLTENLRPGMTRVLAIALCSIIASRYQTDEEVSFMRWDDVDARVEEECPSCESFAALKDALEWIMECWNFRSNCILSPTSQGRCLPPQPVEINLLSRLANLTGAFCTAIGVNLKILNIAGDVSGVRKFLRMLHASFFSNISKDGQHVQFWSCFQVGVFNGGFEGADIKISTSVLKIGHDLNEPHLFDHFVADKRTRMI